MVNQSASRLLIYSLLGLSSAILAGCGGGQTLSDDSASSPSRGTPWTAEIETRSSDNRTLLITDSVRQNQPSISSLQHIQFHHSGLCIDVAKGKVSNGSIYHQWECMKNNPNQQFVLDDRGDGWFGLRAKVSNLCVDVAGGNKDKGGKIQQWTCDNSNFNQSWKKIDKGQGWFLLKSKRSDLCIDVSGAANGAPLYQWSCHGGKNQQFKLVSLESGGNANPNAVAGDVNFERNNGVIPWPLSPLKNATANDYISMAQARKKGQSAKNRYENKYNVVSHAF